MREVQVDGDRVGCVLEEVHGKVDDAMIIAPFSDDQVASLNAYQACGYAHPFTGADSGFDLIATREGWVEEPGGPVVQTWAHDFMGDWSWKAIASDPTTLRP